MHSSQARASVTAVAAALMIMASGCEGTPPRTDGLNRSASLLCRYAYGGSYRSAERALESGADVNQSCGEDGRTPLHLAAERGHKRMVTLLLNNGANPNTPDHDGDTPLHLAAKGGHDRVAILLLNDGAMPNAPDIDGDTPLHLAAKGGHDSTVGVLLAGGADPTIRNNAGQTPRDLAGQHPDVTIQLRQTGG